jgi:mannosyltransferase OCH1-like enzyme
LSLEAAAIGARIGRFEEASKLLNDLSALLPSQAARRAMIRAHMALERGDDSAARDEACKATELAPAMSEAWSFLSQLQLLAGAREDAVASHADGIAQRLAVISPEERGPKTMNTIQGQIINEFRLLAELPDLALMSPQRDQLKSARRLRQRLLQHADNTPLAMGLFNALRRSGLIGTSAPPPFPAGKTPRIPAKVFQFWDDQTPPTQVAEIVSGNRDMNPDWSFSLFNAKSALDYLRERDETRALRAFRNAPHAAAKADIFRLAVLWHEGGLYMDADDRCLIPLTGLVDRRLRHIFYLEPPRTVGNNFIAAEPHSPILRAALDDATRAFSGPSGEAIWLATGPGAVTRALARLGTDEDGVLQDGIWVMPMYRLRQSVAVHLRLPYKRSSAHWLRQLTQMRE